MRLVWLARALADRRTIYTTIEAENPAAALAVDEEIKTRAEQLLAHPELGRRGRVPGTRELILGRYEYLLVYRRRGETIEIMRALHQRQQWP